MGLVNLRPKFDSSHWLIYLPIVTSRVMAAHPVLVGESGRSNRPGSVAKEN